MAKILQVPQGLLSLLALKEQGQNPNELANAVAPSLDLRDFYFARNSQTELGLFGGAPATAALVTGGHGSVGFLVAGVVCTVPQNETWWVTDYVCQVQSIPAADTVRMQGMFIVPGAGAYSITNDVADVVTARARTLYTPKMTRSFFAPPGSQFGVNVFDILAGVNMTITMTMRATRLAI